MERRQQPEVIMTVIRNTVRKGTYLDSVALMRMSRTVAALDGVVECGMMMATPANKRIMADAGVLAADGEAAGPGDLVIALSARDKAAADAAYAAAVDLLDKPKAASGDAAAWTPRTIRAAAMADPAANVVLISVPGSFAVAEARKAINRGLNVMMFSDNVPLADEAALKQEAYAKGVLMMGPDCGTAIIGGVPLAFANVVPRGSIGIVGASGTGIQEVSCLIANNGGGVSHAIGTGGRDLKSDVGGITTLMAIDLLDADPATEHIVIISKPPADDVAAKVLARVGRSGKTFTVCFIGGRDVMVPTNATFAPTLSGAAEAALGKSISKGAAIAVRSSGKQIRGLFAGGTLCAEAQAICLAAGISVASNVAISGAQAASATATATLIDLGDDEYTQGRPHPMIDPAVRDGVLRAALADAAIGVVILDCVLGFGGHVDPAGHLASVVHSVHGTSPAIIASVTGTEADPQRRSSQIAKLRAAGIHVAETNADAVRAALTIIGH
jgi:succinyl-CoA synthetase alpha subunit